MVVIIFCLKLIGFFAGSYLYLIHYSLHLCSLNPTSSMKTAMKFPLVYLNKLKVFLNGLLNLKAFHL